MYTWSTLLHLDIFNFLDILNKIGFLNCYNSEILLLSVSKLDGKACKALVCKITGAGLNPSTKIKFPLTKCAK
jgi:hypothetical protein